MIYKCLRCGYSSDKKCDVKKHLERKKICNSNYTDATIQDCMKVLIKENCSYGFDILMKEIEKLKKNTNVMSNTGDKCINNTGDHNNFITINVHSFEKTDYSVLKDKIHTCIKDGKVDEAKLIKLLHFNKDAPQNHNVMIENKRDKTIKVFNGEEFEDSGYSGKEGIWKFSEKTIGETEKAIGEEIDEQEPTRDEKTYKINQIEKELYNNRKIVNETHLKNKN
jgi:hypothetical protein